MKKFLSLMVCLTLVICSGVLFAACGKKDAPKPSFTVDEDIKTKATKIINELQTKVYNNETNLGKDHDGEGTAEANKVYTYDSLKEALKNVEGKALNEGYWVKAGKLANVDLDKVESITLGGVSYSVGGKFKLSIGSNNFVEDTVFTIDKDGNVSIAAPVVAFELQRKESKLKVGTKEFDFLKNSDAAELKLGKAEFKNNANIADNDEEVTNTFAKDTTKTNTYNLTINSSDDYLLLAPNTGAQPTAEPALKADGKFLVRSVVDGKINSFGITGVDEGGLGIFFGRKEDNSVDPTIDGKKFVYDVYYTETTGTTTTSKAATFTFNVEVEQGNEELTALINDATKEGGNKTVTLPCNFKLTEAVNIDKEVTINLNGNKITEGVQYSKSNVSTMTMFLVKKGGNLTVQGNGEVTSDDLYIFLVENEEKKDENANLVVKGGTYTTDTTIVYLSYGSATIEGGTFKLAGENPKTLWMINGADGKDQNEAKERETTAKIAVKGGTFYVGTNPNNTANYLLVLDKDSTKTDAVVQDGFKVETVSEGVLRVVAE